MENQKKNTENEQAALQKAIAEFDNPVLTNLIFAYYNSTEDNEEDVLNALMGEFINNTKFITAVDIKEIPEIDENGKETGEEKATIVVPYVVTEDNENYLPAFTSYAEFRKWNKDENPKIMIFTFDDYAQLVTRPGATGVAINPYGEKFLISKKIMGILKEKREQNQELAEKSKKLANQVFVGDPKEYPTELIESIENYLESEETIKSAWIKLMYHRGEHGYLVVYDSNTENEAISEEIAYAARPFLKKRFIEVLHYSNDFAKNAIEDTKPFYHRDGTFRINFLKFFK